MWLRQKKNCAYDALFAESPELRQLLRHEQLGLPDGGVDGVPDVVRDGRGRGGGQVLLEITDLFLELERLVLQ